MPDIGVTLREARMARRLDITEVEAATKIRAKYLRALENEEWDLLPGPTFVRTFLRTYGDYLELDSRMLVEEYKQYFQRPSQQDLLPFGGGSRSNGRSSGRGSRSPRPPRGGRGIPPVALVGLVVVVLLGVLFALGTLGGGDDEDPVAEPTPTASATATPGQTAAQRRRARERAARRREAQRPERLRFAAVATGEVSVCVVNGTTDDILIDSQTLADGDRTRTIEAKRLLVVFGNNAVRMRIDGRTIQVPSSGSPIGYDLRAGREPVRLAQADQPSCS